VYPANTSILQTSVDEFRFDMLLQKQLLVIDDIVTSDTLQLFKDAWFKLSWVTPYSLHASDSWHTNRFKYNIMHASEEGEIIFFPASKKTKVGEDNAPLQDENVIAIQVAKGQVVIVPLHWRYMIPDNMHVNCMGVHDIITYALP